MLISNWDIGQYQTCPFLFTKFREPPPLINIKPDIQFIETNIQRMIVKSSELGYVPVFQQVSKIINKDIERLKLAGIDRKTINTCVLTLRDAILKYKTEVFDKGFRPVAFDFDVHIGYASITLGESIPALFLTPNKEIIPAYYANDIDSRSNYIRFNAAMLEEITGFRTTASLLILTGRNFVSMQYRYFKKEEVDRAKKELINILKQMHNTQQTPNTNHCRDCSFIRQCKL